MPRLGYKIRDMVFNPGDYIKTKDGKRGYIVDRIDEQEAYQIRLVHGYDMRYQDELEIDPLMGEDEII